MSHSVTSTRLRAALLPLVRLSLVLLAAAAGGCGKGDPPAAPKVTDTPTVQLVRPQTRTITREVGQPGFIDAYEQTSIYAKLPGYIDKWNVDIGDRIKRGDLLATLSIPELVEEHETKKATVEQDQKLIEQAERLVEVADGSLKAATAQVAEAKANVGKYQAEIDRWASEVKRLTELAKERVIDQQVLDESVRQLKSNTAARDAAQAAVQSAAASQVACQATLAKTKVDVSVAQARLKVATSDERRLAALVGYTKLTAPYDGIVVERNANTGDFVLPAGGDPSASPRSADQSATRATPVYVVARTDVVRVYVDVPEADANYVQKGTKATVRVQALQDDGLPAAVTRTSWALNVKSRTLRAEIDLPNRDAKLLPGMYAYGKVLIERPNVRVLPRAAVVEIGNQMYCYLHENGKAVRTAVQTGISDGTWVEVTRKQVRSPGADAAVWCELTGSEEVIVGDLTELSDGQRVNVAR